MTTFKVGGCAQYFVEVKDKRGLLEAAEFSRLKSLPIFILGGGNDILVSDKGFKGLVIRYIGENLELKEKVETVIAKAEAGLTWDNLVKVAVTRGLQGIECLSGIPGSVGAAPIQNIGAYGQELEDVFVRLSAYDFREEKFKVFSRRDCQFDYRESVFKRPENKGRYIITDITLKLRKNALPSFTYRSLTDYLEEERIRNPSLSQVREAVLVLRGQKLDDPRILGNAGSFFKNPLVNKNFVNKLLRNFPDIPYYASDGKYKLFAGWLIDKAGWKGRKVGGAMVSNTNALVLTNPEGNASAKDIIKLSQKVKEDIKTKFNVELEPEVQFIGF